MQRVIYKSETIVPWDTQSAFKMTSYTAKSEENMIFCYLKAYVHGGDLVLCSYCFSEHPRGRKDLRMYINPFPENQEKPIKIVFGYEGVDFADTCGIDLSELIEYHSFKSDDEQGFYWCGEIRLGKKLIWDIYGTELKEKSLVTMNMVQHFENGDISVLFGNASDKNYNPVENMEVFAVLNY